MTAAPRLSAQAQTLVREALVREAARFARLGWMRATSGNLSAVVSRDPLRLLVTASGRDKDELTPADIVEVDAAGRLAAQNDRTAQVRPSAEAELHATLAAATGAGAVVHLHTVACVAAAARHRDGLELSGIEMLKALGRPADGPVTHLRVVANSQDMLVLGAAARRVLDPADPVPALLVAGHGMYAWGPDLRAARRHAEAVDWLCALALATAGGYPG
jgi:methylthioribulose-1-phosphate dehydratase